MKIDINTLDRAARISNTVTFISAGPRIIRAPGIEEDIVVVWRTCSVCSRTEINFLMSLMTIQHSYYLLLAEFNNRTLLLFCCFFLIAHVGLFASMRNTNGNWIIFLKNTHNQGTLREQKISTD